MSEVKRKKGKRKVKDSKEILKLDYTEEEKARIARYAERCEREPIKLKKGRDSSHNPSLQVEESDKVLGPVKMMEALGTPDSGLQSHLLSQAIRTFEGCIRNDDDFGYDRLEEFGNNSMALLNGIQPRDEIEGMLAVQMIGVHNLAMQTLKRAMITEQTFDGKRANVNQATKMLRTFTAQMEALKKYRTGGQQKVTVEHVHVSQGGQAIVGAVHQGGGGISEKKRG